MPSSDTVTGFTAFSANTLIKSSDINTNFNLWRGHILPVDASVSASATLTYDVGSTTYRWRDVFGKVAGRILEITSTYTVTGQDDVLICNPSGGAFTITLPAISGNGGKKFLFIHSNSNNNSVTINRAGSDTIDNGATTLGLQRQFQWIELTADSVNSVWRITSVGGSVLSTSVTSLTNFPTTAGEYGDFGSFSVTPGQWALSGVISYYSNGAVTTTDIYGGFGTVTGNNGSGLTLGTNYQIDVKNQTASRYDHLVFPDYYVRPTANTTYYIKMRADGSITGLQYVGSFNARRV